MTNAFTQKEPLKGAAAVRTSGYRRCLDPSLGAGTGSRPARRWCAQVEDFLQKVAELQEAVRRLRSIREAEEELDTWFQVQTTVKLPPAAKTSPSSTHRRRGGGAIMKGNGSLQQQGPEGGRDFP